ncbi:MAG: glycine zipper 2TM domain-containing protein [Ignavibacteria bacterium]
MRTARQLLAASLVLAVLTGCADMSARDRNTISGAAIGGVAGSILTDGSPAGTVGGAAVGGYIGNQLKRWR